MKRLNSILSFEDAYYDGLRCDIPNPSPLPDLEKKESTTPLLEEIIDRLDAIERLLMERPGKQI